MKQVLINIAKILVAAAIILWLFKNGKLEPESVLKLFSNPVALIPLFILLVLQIFIGALRWQTILRIKSHQLKDIKHLFLVQWIGQSFSSALPGAVTGDLIKLAYVKKMDHSLSRKFLLLSVLMDRLIGLFGLLFISGLVSLLFYQDLIALGPEMYKIIMINFFMLVCALIAIGFFFLPERFIDSLIRFIKIARVQNMLESFKSIRMKKMTFIHLVALSSLSHFIGILVFHLINRDFYQSSIGLHDLMTVIPIGQITIAIPISPSGLGVGHLAYQKLFSFIHQTNGATLFNNFWIFSLTVNLLGFIPYVFLGRTPKSTEQKI